jgi:hypothetical protein
VHREKFILPLDTAAGAAFPESEGERKKVIIMK